MRVVGGKVVRFLTQLEVNNDAHTNDEKPDLLKACEKGDAELVRHLIESGADIDTCYQSVTPLMVSSYKGFDAIVEFLIDQCCLLDLQNKKGMSALMLATRNGHVSIVQKLINSKANLNLTDNTGTTALMIAISKGIYPVAHLLIESGVDLMVKNREGTTALHILAKGR